MMIRITMAAMYNRRQDPPMGGRPSSGSVLRCAFMPDRKDVREQPICAFNTGRELTEEREPGVDIHTLADRSDEEPSAPIRFSGVMGGQYAVIAGIPAIGK
jgi:hypothetical protein